MPATTTANKLEFPHIEPTDREPPYPPSEAPKLTYFPLENYESIKDWLEAIGGVLWGPTERLITQFLEARPNWVVFSPKIGPKAPGQTFYPADSPVPHITGWYRHTGRTALWEPVELEAIPGLLSADTEGTRAEKRDTCPYRPFLFGGLGADGYWYMWHCNDENLPDTVPFPESRVVIGHNFSGYDAKYLSCENSIATGRRTTILDTLAMVTAYQGISNQQQGKYKAIHNRVVEGEPAPIWYAHATEGGLDHAVLRILGISIDKGIRNAMVEETWGTLHDVHTPSSIVEYWAQDVWYMSELFRVLYPLLRHTFLPSVATWVGMAEMAGTRLWLRDWSEFLSNSDTAWLFCKKNLADVVEYAANRIIEAPLEVKDLYRQYQDTVKFIALDDTADPHPDQADIVIQELPAGEFSISISPMDAERSFVFRVDAELGCHTFGFMPEDLTPSAKEAFLKRERAVHTSLKRIAADPDCLWGEQGDLIAKLAAVFDSYKPTPNRSGVFNWTPVRNGPSKGKPTWYKKLASKGTAKNPKQPFSIGTQAAVYLLDICWDGQPINYVKLGNKGGWVDATGKPLPHPSGGANLGTPFCKDYLSHVTSGQITSGVISQDELVDIFKQILLSGQWTQFRGRYHGVYTCDSEFEGLKFVKPEINPSGTQSRRATSSVWVVTPNEKEIFDGSIKIGSNIQDYIVAPPGYKVVGADFTSQESWLATIYTDARNGKVASTPWCESVLHGQRYKDAPEKDTDTHSIVGRVMDIPRKLGKGMNFSCVPTDNSQALTRRGWVDAHDLAVGEEIMTYNPTLDVLEWQPLDIVTIYPAAEVIEMRNDDYTIESTGDHRWYGERRLKFSDGSSKWEAQEFTTDSFNTMRRIKVSAPFESSAKSFLEISVEDAALVGLLLTDGYFKWSEPSTGPSTAKGERRGCVASIFQSKAHNIPFFDWACAHIGHRKFIQPGWSKKNVAKDVTVWYIRAGEFRDLWRRCELDPDNPDYTEFVLRLNSACLAKFWEAVVRADAHTFSNGSHEIGVYQSERSKLDAFALAATLMGYRLLFSKRKSSGSNPSEPYRVSFRAVPHRYVSGQRITKTVSRTTEVWCPTVKNGFWLMRQGDFISITGNCQYGAGIAKLVTILMLGGIPREVAEHKASLFIQFLKGPSGIAKQKFATLRELANTPAIRTAILGCLVPESIDARWCGGDFITTRQNWLIQSAGVDCIHTLLTIMCAFILEYELDAFLLTHRHDAAYFAVKEEHVEQFRKCYQEAHYITKQLAYEQAVIHANNLTRASNSATAIVECPPLECPPSQRYFEEIKVADCVGAAG